MKEGQPDIFISRHLDETSVLADFLIQEKLSAQAFSLIEFTPLTFELPKSDWIFFYSKSGVKFFFDQIADLSQLDNFKWATFGSATARFLEHLIQSKVDYKGNSKAIHVAQELSYLSAGSSICFVCGQQSLRSVQNLWLTENPLSEVITYDNKAKDKIQLPKYRIAILTSPMNVHTFIKAGGQAKYYIAIGPTTAKALAQYTDRITIAVSPSEAGIVDSLKSLLATKQ